MSSLIFSVKKIHFYTPPHDSVCVCVWGGGLLYFHVGRLCVCPSICHTSVVHPSVHLSVFRFRKKLSKRQWIFTKPGICIDIVETWFEIANGQVSSIFYGVICLGHDNGGVS